MEKCGKWEKPAGTMGWRFRTPASPVADSVLTTGPWGLAGLILFENAYNQLLMFFPNSRMSPKFDSF